MAETQMASVTRIKLLRALTFYAIVAVTLAQTPPQFTCKSTSKCRALIDYIPPNATTIAAVQSLFEAKNLHSFLGANNLPANTSSNFPLPAAQKIKIQFTCKCENGTGRSDRHPIYKIQSGDTLEQVADSKFARLVTFPQIAAANGIVDAGKITVGQEVWIPLPCSCDEVEGNRVVVHYGHLVESGSSVSAIAGRFNVSEETILKINGIVNAADLKASQVLDVPLTVNIPSTLNSMATSIIKLNGTNYSEWKEQVEFSLGLLELDLALLREKPTPLTDESTPEENKIHNDWERSNRLSLMFLRMVIDTNIKTSLPKTESAKEYLQAIEDRFKTADKSLAGKLMADLVTMKFDGSHSMSAHVIEMINIAAKLKNLGLVMDDAFLVQFILTSLPPQYEPFKIHYNTITEKWSLNELTNKLVQEESRQGPQSIKVAHFTQGVGKQFGKKNNSTHKRGPPKFDEPSQSSKKKKEDDACKFCKKPGHYQVDCAKRKAWFEKKGIHYNPNHKPK